MTIKAFELSSVEAKRFAKSTDKPTNLRIDHNSTVTLITEISEREASVDFRFTANYRAVEEVVGLIRIEGRIVYEGQARNLVRQWTSTNQMPNEVANEIHTVIMSNCIPEAVMIARDLRLPPPIPMPTVNIPAQQPPSKQRQGMEVM
jgi:hypothetical protein